QLRKDFDAPNAKFVCATLGQTEKGATDGGGKILDAMLAVDGNSGRYPEFKGNVATVYSHPLSKGGSSGGHYGGNAETYMNVGEAMGRAMVKLMKSVR
ncbi:MAG TPA: sialate O-acetylesterase, partial [Verrucomicrobia bacterium]|nr:sialate O-acetylesterase [Verrucomicrobiota bacterium]